MKNLVQIFLSIFTVLLFCFWEWMILANRGLQPSMETIYRFFGSFLVWLIFLILAIAVTYIFLLTTVYFAVKYQSKEPSSSRQRSLPPNV